MKNIYYTFTVYINTSQETSYAGFLKDGKGNYVESIYAKFGVTTVGRLIERCKDITAQVIGYTFPLIAIDIVVHLVIEDRMPYPTLEETRKRFEDELRERLIAKCFFGYVKENEMFAKECFWAPYSEFTDLKPSKKFLKNFYNEVRDLCILWEKSYSIFESILPFTSWKFDDISRNIVELYKDYRLDKDKSSENQHKIVRNIVTLFKDKFQKEVNENHYRIPVSGDYGFDSLENLVYSEDVKPLKTGGSGFYWRTRQNPDTGEKFIYHITEINVDNLENRKVSFKDKNTFGDGVYDVDDFNRWFNDPRYEPCALLPHNMHAYILAKQVLMSKQRICMERSCGTGKSYIMAALSKDFKNVLVVVPSREIKKRLRNIVGNRIGITYKTYQSLINASKFPENLDLIILDECHHVVAPKWMEGVNKVIFANPTSKIVGFTATADRGDGRNVIYEFFEGNSVAPLSMPKAWSDGILKIPLYIGLNYNIKEETEEMLEVTENLNIDLQEKEEFKGLINKVRVDWERSGGIPGILHTYLPESTERMIVFFENIEELKQQKNTVKQWLIDGGFNPIIAEIHSKNTDKVNINSLLDFESKVPRGSIRVILSVNMFNEGVHIPGVEAVMFLRKTSSLNVYLQQMGRCSSVNGKQPIVFDFIGNFDNVGYGGILGFIKELNEEENKKIASGDKTEKERLILEFNAELKSQLELFEKFEELISNKYHYLVKWAENMVNTGNFSDLVTIKRGSPEQRWFCQIGEDRYSEYLINLKRLVREQCIILNPDLIKIKTDKEKLILIEQINNSGDYTSLIGDHCKNLILRKFIELNKDTNDLCKHVWYKIMELKDGSNKYLKIARDIVENGQWEKCNYVENRELYDWGRNHKTGGSCIYYPEADLICEHWQARANYTTDEKKLSAVIYMNENNDYSLLYGDNRNRAIFIYIRENKEESEQCKKAWDNLQMLKKNKNTLTNKIKDIVNRSAWNEAELKNNPLVYLHVKRSRYCNSEAKIIWEHIKNT